MRSLSSIFVRFCLVVLIGAALNASAFAHRIGPNPGLLAFMAHGGTIADICDDTGAPPSHFTQDCEACHLVAAVAVPAAPLVLCAPTTFTVATVAPAPARPLSPVGPANQSRAPPVLSI